MATHGLGRTGPLVGPEPDGRKMRSKATGTAPRERAKTRSSNTQSFALVQLVQKIAVLANQATKYANASQLRRFDWTIQRLVPLARLTTWSSAARG
jgi:hypothetical protein